MARPVSSAFPTRVYKKKHGFVWEIGEVPGRLPTSDLPLDFNTVIDRTQGLGYIIPDIYRDVVGLLCVCDAPG